MPQLSYGKFTHKYPIKGDYINSYKATLNAIEVSKVAINDFQKIAIETIKILDSNIHNIEGRYNYLFDSGRTTEAVEVETILREIQLQRNILQKMKDMPTLIASSNRPVDSPLMQTFDDTRMSDRPHSPRSIVQSFDQSRGGKKTRKHNKKGKKRTRRY